MGGVFAPKPSSKAWKESLKQLLGRYFNREAQAGDAAPGKVLCPRHLGRNGHLSEGRCMRVLVRAKHQRSYLEANKGKKLVVKLVPSFLCIFIFSVWVPFHRYLGPELVIFRGRVFRPVQSRL